MKTHLLVFNLQRLLRGVLAVLLAVFAPITFAAESSQAPVHLAIVVLNPVAAPAGDLLTVALSKRENLQLLERSKIEQIWREQALSAGNRDYLKLGKVLGADGLLLLETTKEGGNNYLSIQLIAVKAGVLLSSERFAWPISNLAQWTTGISAHLKTLLPKLGVLAKDALPISVVNLRSAIQSSQSREVERELTLLAIERLSREKQLFVLERRRMQLMTDEKNLRGLDDSAFWDGSYLLDGVVDRNGYAHDTMTITARLVPPGNGAPLQVEVSGSRTNSAEVINRLAEGILKALAVEGSPQPWNPSDEAEQFYSEAQWAFKWGLYPQAQAATEAAWALERRTPETAQLLIRAYVESIPDEPGNGTDVHVLQVPDASVFPKLDRGLDFLAQNGEILFKGTNSSECFRLGLRLMRESFGQLESYYYAAEMRPKHLDDLISLRSKTRENIKVLDRYAGTLTNLYKWNDPRVTYTTLKWIEAGVAFERPDDSLRFYRDILFAGAKAEGLPRIIGWTWPDRQRVPNVIRHLIDDTRGSTNMAVRLEGLFLALLLAPDDEQGSFRNAEEQLLSALWDNRELLFRDADRATLVERTRLTLGKKNGDDSIYKAFSGEPFASFKHRLRKAFLQDVNNNTNFAVLDEFFPNTNVKMETPEQARELLPLMESLQKSPVVAKRIDYKISILQNTAGVAKDSPKTQPLLEAAAVLDATFVPWQLSQNRLSAGCSPRFSGMIVRDGKLWVRVRYIGPNQGDYGDTLASSYISVHPERGVTGEIFFPDQNGYSSRLFEISSNSLFVEAGGNLFKYGFQEKSWTKIPVPMEGASSLVDLNGRLFVGRPDGLLAVTPESGTAKVLVSSHRTPPANEIDPLWSPRAKIFPFGKGKLGALVEDYFLVFDPVAERWNVRPMPLKDERAAYMLTVDYLSLSGAQRLLTGPYMRRHLIGFWDDGPAESLLVEETQMPLFPPGEKHLPPLRWDWPKPYPLEYSQIVADEKKLWVLAPRMLGIMAKNPEPVNFSDQRDGTLFCFTPDARAPLSIPVRFPTAGLTNLIIMNGHLTSVLDPENFGHIESFERFNRHVGNLTFWLRVPGGLVLGGPNYCGHWFIADSASEEQFFRQSELWRASTNQSASRSTAPEPP